MATYNQEVTSLSEVEQVLTCQICLNPLIRRSPRILKCLHTFCTPCLESIVEGNFITCPNCRQFTTLQGGDISDLPLNFTIEQTNEMIRSLGMVDLCNTCWMRGEFILAVVKCRTCDRRLCQDCVKEHNKYPGFQNHPMEQMHLKTTKGVVDFCKVHVSKYVHFCSECDELLCTDCLLSGKHGSHPDAVKEVFQYSRQLRAKFVPKGECMRKRMEETKANLDQWKNLVEHFTDVKEEIEDAAKKIRKDLDEQIDGMLRDLADNYLTVTEKGISVHVKYLAAHQKAFNFVNSTKSDCDVVLSRMELELNRQCMEETEGTLEELTKPDRIKFLKDLKLSFGALVCESEEFLKLPANNDFVSDLKIQKDARLRTEEANSPTRPKSDVEDDPEVNDLVPEDTPVHFHLKEKTTIINRFYDERLMSGFGIGALQDGTAVVVSRGGKGLLLYDSRKWILSTYAASRTINRVSVNNGRVLYTDGEKGVVFEVVVDDNTLNFRKEHDIKCSRHSCPSFDSKGNIIVTPASDNESLRKYDANGKLVWFKKLYCGYGQHICAATTKEGEMYIFSDSTRSEVRIWNEHGKHVCELKLKYGNVKPYPMSSSTTPNGTILVADKGNHTVSEYAIDGSFLRHVLTEDDGIRCPVGISCDPSGLLWISEFESGYGTHCPQNRLVIYQLH